MKNEKSLKDKISLLEKESATVTGKLEVDKCRSAGYKDLKLELKGLRVFMGQTHPDHKSQFPEIVRKISYLGEPADPYTDKVH